MWLNHHLRQLSIDLLDHRLRANTEIRPTTVRATDHLTTRDVVSEDIAHGAETHA